MSQTDADVRAKPWWRERIMWLVVGGPLTVVVAGFATLAIALKFPDPVLDTSRSAASSADDGAQAMQPAIKARNHAATGGK